MAPDEAKNKVRPLFDGAMKGRTMYVVPYILGPETSPYSKVGVELTDSSYVVASMRIMSRIGKAALDRLGSSSDFVPGSIRSAISIRNAASFCIFPRKN